MPDANAIVMTQYGPPEVLRSERVPLTPLQPGEIRIRTLAAAVNRSDLEIRAGHWPIRRPNPFPYIPGIEVVGEVADRGAAVTTFQPGDRVITMMQGLGGVRAERPGSYAEFVTVGADGAAPVPAGLDPLEMAALGLASVTAYEGLRRLGALDGRRILITGASGGVGSAAIGVAKAHGAEVVAVVSRPDRGAYVRSLGAAEALLPDDVRPDSVDGVLETVGGGSFGRSVAALRQGGALSLVGAVGGNDVQFDAFRLMDATLTGYSSESLDGPALRAAIAAIADWLGRDSLTPPARTCFALHDAAAAHRALEERRIEGRVLLTP